MWSYGTLKWSQWGRKKNSEELRLRSIDWRGQKVPRDEQNYTKGDHVFGPGERSDNGMLLTIKILMILCSGRVRKLDFALSKWHFIENLMQNWQVTIFRFFEFFQNLKFRFLSKFDFLVFFDFVQNSSFLFHFSCFCSNFVPILLIFPIFLTSWCMYRFV